VPEPPVTAKATEASADRRAADAIHDPRKLARAARVFRHALAAGLVTPDGHLIDSRDNSA
jgi:hypothetical protein